MDEDSVKSIFEELEGYFDALGIEERDVSKECVDGVDYMFMNCGLGNEPLQFIAAINENWDHVILRYPFDIVENLAVDLQRKDDAQERLDDLDTDDYIEDAKHQMSEMDINWNEVKYGLAERLVSENCYFTLEQSENLPLKGFRIDKRIFPRKDFGLKDLDDAVETVIGRGMMGRLWLANCMDKTDEIFSGSHTNVDREQSTGHDLGYIG